MAAVGFQPGLGERALLLLNYQATLGRVSKGALAATGRCEWL